jgi:hypothetical protein
MEKIKMSQLTEHSTCLALVVMTRTSKDWNNIVLALNASLI